MDVFVNRTLNLKKIKAIGFDMDYTLVRYNTEEFEHLVHQIVIKKLVDVKNFPKEVGELTFNFQRAIQGLVIDKNRGNLLKISRFGKVKNAYHGEKRLEFHEQQSIYSNRVIDLSQDQFQSLDTSFSISNGVLFSQLVELKEQGAKIPEYHILAQDIKDALDMAHADGTLKSQLRQNLDKYVIKDPQVVELMERLKRYGKKIMVITNSEFEYTKALLEYAIDPYLKEHKNWMELFDITITLSRKPSFFTNPSGFLAIDPSNGLMSNAEGVITNGVYQGGSAGKLQKDLNLEGEEILYLGDHIYGDVVSIKKTFNWRTGLVLDPLEEEVNAIKQSAPIQEKIDQLMEEKEVLEHDLNELKAQQADKGEKTDPKVDETFHKDIAVINESIGKLIDQYRKLFNPYWGEMMRAGQEESRFADQVEKYACIYMTKVSDLLAYSPRSYFRPKRRTLPHER